MKTALILPAYNESAHISDMVHRALGFVDQLIVIDDCSQDETFDEAKKAGAIALRHRELFDAPLNQHHSCILKMLGLH